MRTEQPGPQALAELWLKIDPHILLCSREESNSSIAEETARRLGYFAVFEAAPSAYDQGLALVTRYPITDVQIRRLKACDLRFRSRNRFAMRATLQTPWGDLRVWNVHLDTRINAEERLD